MTQALLDQPVDTIEREPIAAWRIAHESNPQAIESARRKAQHMLGGLAVAETAHIETVAETEPNPTTLLSAIQTARLGDEQSRRAVELNIQTNVAELLYKAGHQTSVAMELEDGVLTQAGRRLADIQANSLRYTTLNPLMRRRVEQELQNVFAFENLIESGDLTTHDAVVFSLCPTDETTKKDYGFFGETDTCSIQMMRLQDDETMIELETALVAGKRSPYAERHDRAAIAAIAQENGTKLELEDEEDSLRYIVLVPKEEVPNGVSDIVARYDSATGGTFYGQESDAETKGYAEHAAKCERKNRDFSETVEKITEELLAEAHQLKTPMEAIKRLHKLTERYLVKDAVADETIDARVFGGESAAHIASARAYLASGDQAGALDMQAKAIEAAVSSSCPLFSGKKQNETDSLESLLGAIGFGEDKYGSLRFKCKAGHENVRPRNQLIEKCQQCGKSVRC